LQHEVGSRLIERLEFFNIDPEIILDLGMGTGYVTKQLATKYNQANIIGLDFAKQMLDTAKNKNLSNLDNCSLLCGDINNLPLADNSADIIFSNFTMQWCDNIGALFRECYRVLKPNGLLMFSIPGPSTMYELRKAFDTVDPDYHHINNFIDMHNIGDILVQNQFAHPVMDNDEFTLVYSKVINILKDIKAIGANVKLSDNYRKSLFTKTKLLELNSAYEQFKQDNGKYPLTYEVIYGHAFKLDKPVKVKYPELSEAQIPIEKIIKK